MTQKSKIAVITIREVWLLLIALFFAALSFGAISSAILQFGVNWEIAGSLVSAAVAIIALPVAIVGYLDNRASQRLEHRAYISLRLSRTNLIVGQPADLAVELINYGRTPAHETRVLVTIGIWPEDINTMPTTAMPTKKSETSVHPGSQSIVYTDGGFFITQAEYDAIQRGDTQLAVRIVCAYRDVFGDQHETHMMGRVQDMGESIRVSNADVGNWAN